MAGPKYFYYCKDKFSEIDTKHNNKIEKDKYFKSKILVLDIC
jgi:hypothetical protein